MHPKVSVVMPVYNSAITLPRAIESILRQTFCDFELIIINDFGSTDGSKEIIENYAARDSRVRLVQLNERKGIAESLNIGIREAQGKYIARMDADDVSYSQRISIQWNYMETHPQCTLCGSFVRVVSPTGVYTQRFPSDNDSIKAELLFFNPIRHPSVIFPAQYFKEHNLFYRADYFCEDYDLWTRIDGEFSILPKVLIDYHYGETSNISIRARERMHYGAATVIENQLQLKFGMDTKQFHKGWFFPAGAKVDCSNIGGIEEAFYLLAEIEKKNLLVGYCNPNILSKILCRQWNRYVADFFLFYNTDENNGLPCLPPDRINSFREAISIMLQRDGTMVAEELKQLWNRMLVQLQHLSFKRVVVFGIGSIAREYFLKNPKYLHYVIAFCDNDVALQGGELFNRCIISPNDLMYMSYDVIIIASLKYYGEIQAQLINNFRVPVSKIASLGLFAYSDGKQQ